MYYRHILTYNFSDNDTRSSFEKMISNLGYVEAEDQSTYVLPFILFKTSDSILDTIIAWSVNKDIHVSSDDFVQLFYLLSVTVEAKKVAKIANKFLRYDPKTKGLICE